MHWNFGAGGLSLNNTLLRTVNLWFQKSVHLLYCPHSQLNFDHYFCPLDHSVLHSNYSLCIPLCLSFSLLIGLLNIIIKTCK